jgi:hypothetical protein
MKIILLIIGLSVLSFMLNSHSKKITKESFHLGSSGYSDLEKAYFEGQRNAIKGRIDISFDKTKNRYIWTRSPWDTGRNPTFEPSTKDNNVN